jgi:hypothetical protein
MRTVWILCLCALAVPARAQSVELRLKASALVAARSYKLQDLAEIADAPADLAARLAAVTIGPSPRIGYRERIERREIEQRLRSQAGVREVGWSGAQAVVVETAATFVAGREIADAAALHLERTLQADRQRLAMSLVEDVADVRVPQGAVRLQPRSLAYSEALRRRAVVWIDVLVDGTFYRSVPVSFRVEVWRAVVGAVTVERVSAGVARSNAAAAREN